MLEFILRLWHLTVMSLASQLNREQQHIIEYLQEENQELREKLGKKRILLNQQFWIRTGQNLKEGLSRNPTDVA